MYTSLRIANTNDLQLIQHLGVKTFVDSYAAKNNPVHFRQYLNEKFSLQHLRMEMENPDSMFFLGCYRKVPIGYLKLNTDLAQSESGLEKGLEIERIYVLRHYQGKGLGSLFITHADEMARKLQKKFLWLGVWEKNPEAISFYEKQGFSIFDTHDFVMGDEIQKDYLMKRDL